MKKHEWVTPNRMKFESLHKTYNRQMSMITTGNQMGNTVFSLYIRPYTKTKLKWFPASAFTWKIDKVKNFIKQIGKEKQLILYVFFHWQKGKRITHGAILTEGYPEYKHIRTFYFKNTAKSISILEEAKKYICN